MRRLVLSLVIMLVASSHLHSTVTVTHNKTSKEKPVVTTTTIPLGVTHEDMVKWSRVSICEMGGNWKYQGPIYSGGLGIRNTNWVAYGGLKYAPNAGLATPEQQVAVAKTINAGYNVPDQNGCGRGW